MKLQAVILVLSLTLFLGGEANELTCLGPHLDCMKKGLDITGFTEFNVLLQGKKGPICKFRRSYKECAHNNKKCLESASVSHTIKLLDKATHDLKCGCASIVESSATILASLLFIYYRT